MMPDFAKGWEKDGWSVAYRGDNKVQKDFLDGTRDEIRAVIYEHGLLVLKEVEGCLEYGKVPISCGDPLIAKQKAEQLMEGL